MQNGYLEKFDWFILKPLWFFFIAEAIFFLFQRQWVVGVSLFVISHLIGMVAAALHASKSFSELAHPTAKLAFQRELEPLGAEESYRIAKAAARVGYIIGLAFFILSIHYELIRWYFALPLSILIAWICRGVVGIFFALLAAGFSARTNKAAETSLGRSEWEAKLKGANFEWVKGVIIRMLEMGEEEAKQRGGHFAYKQELLDVLTPFMAKPCLETAIKLLEYEPSFFAHFEQSKSIDMF